MSTRIEKDFIFEAGIYFEGTYTINVFEMTLAMDVVTTQIHEQSVAIERMNHFVYNSLQNCVFVQQTEIDAIERFTNAGINVCSITDEPYDQIIASLIMIKINAILEKRLTVEDIVFGSKITGGIRFMINFEDLPKTMFTGSKNWWNSSDCKINNFSRNKDNVVNLFQDDWVLLDLTWKEKKE